MVEKTECTSIGQTVTNGTDLASYAKFFDGSNSSTSILGCALCLPFVSHPTPHIINQVTRLLIITTTNRQTKKQLFDQHKNYKVLLFLRVCFTSNNCLLSITTIQVMQSRVSHAQQQFLKSAICQFGEPNWFIGVVSQKNSTKSKHWSTKDLFQNNW